MNYKSTRDNDISVGAAEAISRGISKEGGLFVPERMPWLSYNDLNTLASSDYVSRAADVLGRFLDDFSAADIIACITKAYTRENFETESIAPIYELSSGMYMLELWHGPTCAFKDMALQLLPHLLCKAVSILGEKKTVVILVATSGDTGKAALEGFKDVEGTKIMVFYPEQGVSPMQKLQMVTQEGENVFVCAIKGNFDDAQNGVKAVFTNNEVIAKLEKSGMTLSSANSINWGRLSPQIVYYISAYCDLIKNKRICCGEPINIVVPTGNFGNILSAYYAKKMGIPVNRLICASNANNVLTDFLRTGIYDRNRPFYTTISPSMDILISSNLERLLYDLSACDDKKICGWMKELTENGVYEVDSSIKTSLSEQFWSGSCDDVATKETIKNFYTKYSYVCDPHTAVALNVYEQYKQKTADATKTIIASTASPFKFAGDVLEAIEGERPAEDEAGLISLLSSIAMQRAPKQITALFNKQERFNGSCEKTEMIKTIFSALKIDNIN
jgi:threonine synthase